MKLAIIAAGEGSRLRAEGVVVPKPLVRVNGVPMIERIIGLAVQSGISDICCIVNERIAGSCDYLQTQADDAGAHLTLLARSTPSSMHSLFALAPVLGDEPFCLATTDTVFRADEFRGYIARARREHGADGLLAVTRFVDDESPLWAQMDARMNIMQLSDTPDHHEWVTGGLYCFTPRIFDLADEALEAGIQRLRNFLRLLLSHDYALSGFPFTKMIDVDRLADIKAAEQLLADEAGEAQRPRSGGASALSS